MESRKYRKNKTTELFRKLDKFIFLCSSTNFWVDDNGIPELTRKAYRILIKVLNGAVVLFMVSELGSFFTQHNLTEKQQSNQVFMPFSHIILYSFTWSLIHDKEAVTELLFVLAVDLKKDFNDEDTETRMLKRTKFFTCVLICLCFNSLLLYGIEGFSQVLFSDGTFVTMITFWPEVHDQTLPASICRVGIYIVWWLWMIRVIMAYVLVIAITISLSHQYRNLQLYFKSIANIFEERLSQREKEEKYERALKLGISLHSTTIWCTKQVQRTCGKLFSGHIVTNVYVMVQLMSQLKQTDRSLGQVLPIAVTIAVMLFSTGIIMWNAGDITVEAGNLPTAIFLSGWQNCTHKCSYRVRRTVLIAMAQSQKPVIIKSCGFIELSYDSYITVSFIRCTRINFTRSSY
uniref:Odorant receptor n=1 Tax=Grapholita molesta TaxID=192188 RepID=A0A9Y1IRZ2_GRAMO|nr:odorant-receptor-25 [Grapholita molesta]